MKRRIFLQTLKRELVKGILYNRTRC